MVGKTAGRVRIERGVLSGPYGRGRGLEREGKLPLDTHGVGSVRERRTERHTGRMPKRGMCKSGGWHAILVATVAILAVTTVEPVSGVAPSAQAQSANAIRDIRVSGNRRGEPETVPSYLKFNVGDASDSPSAHHTATAP